MNEITSAEELDACIEASNEKPVLLFKHSTSCPTSARANQRMGEFAAESPEGYPEVLMVKVIESRAVSNAIEEKLGVEHASPQLILVKDGKAVWSTSHYNIQARNIEGAIEKYGATA